MPSWAQEFLQNPSGAVAAGIWNYIIAMVQSLLQMDYQTFNTSNGASSDTWRFVRFTLYPWALSIGAVMLNLFLIIAMCQAAMNLHANITLELCIEALLKIVIVNAIYLNLMRIMDAILDISRLMCREIGHGVSGNLQLSSSDFNGALSLTSLLFGMVFIIVALVCSCMILLAVYGRYLKLYLLIVMAPIAIAPLAGGQKTEQTFHSFLRTFLLHVFEIVVIQIVLLLAGMMMKEGFNLFGNEGFGNVIANVINADAINAMFVMILTASMVKGANAFLSKAFGL